MQFSWPSLDASRKLSAEEATELAARVAELTKAGLPLGDGLRALAGELSGRRLPHVLRVLADRLDAGDDLGRRHRLGRPPSSAAPARADPGRAAQRPAGRSAGGIRRSRTQPGRAAPPPAGRACSIRSSCWRFLTAMTVVARVFIIGPIRRDLHGLQHDVAAMTKWFIHSSWPVMWGMVVLLCAWRRCRSCLRRRRACVGCGRCCTECR